MATLTHEALRRSVFGFGGCDEYFTEMIQAGTLLTGGPFEKYYLHTGPEPDKIVWQLTGAKADALARAAELVAGVGGVGVDVNMGCCAPEIVKSGAGIAWMLKPYAETAAMLEGVRRAVENAKPAANRPAEENAKPAANRRAALRFSVKIRLGDEDFTDDRFFSFIDMLVGTGVRQITLHPRTRKERYRTPPRLEYVRKLCDYLNARGSDVKVVLNGAVCDAASARKAYEIAPAVDGIMIARAAIRKPWVFAEIKGTAPEKIDLLQTGLQFIDDLAECQPPEFYKTRLQRFFTYYSDNVQFAQYLRTQLLNAPTLDGCRERLAAYFDQCPHERYKKIAP